MPAYVAYPPMSAVTPYPVLSLAPIKHLRMVIFDWDDTLFPTTAWTVRTKLKKSSATLPALYRVGKAVYDVLAHYLKLFGAKNVRVVTNGSKSWVLSSLKQCSQRYRKLCAHTHQNANDEKTDIDAKVEKETEQKPLLMKADAEADYFAAIYNS